ncbi:MULTISPECIES: response regulator [unclassified Streptomyces]|uniref:response regulator n=1 Tax=unclassified Streptomyces TaxID=2593676 RepID=UPI0004C0168A|nr:MULTISPECIES: response regulator [unclassified Streptomyces]
MMSTSPAAPSSILIVDDMEENLIAFEAVLGPLHQHLVRARSGEQALKAMLRQEFAVVLLDVRMPGMDGLETAANIKRLDQTKDVPIILVTGTEGGADYAYRGYAIGAADFLAKPVDPWVLRTKVNVFLELHRKNRQLAMRAAREDADRLTEITERLAEIVLLLRDRPEVDRGELVDRIAEVERAVGALLPDGTGTE